MRLLRTTRAALLLITGITLAATTTTANAASTRQQDTCAWGLLCVYDEPFWADRGLSIPTVPSGQCRGYPFANWRSSSNFTNVYVRLWDRTNCTGANKLINPGESIGDLGFGASGVGGL